MTTRDRCSSTPLCWILSLSLALPLAGCVSPLPGTYTAEEFEVMKAGWVALLQSVDESCQTETEYVCGGLNVVALDSILDDGKDMLSPESYETLWNLEQNYRNTYGFEGPVYDGAPPVPEPPAVIAARQAKQAKQRAAYDNQQMLLMLLLAASGGGGGAASQQGLTPSGDGIPVYNASQCVGPIIMGQCQGSTIGPPRATCHGTMLNGRCTGPMF